MWGGIVCEPSSHIAHKGGGFGIYGEEKEEKGTEAIGTQQEVAQRDTVPKQNTKLIRRQGLRQPYQA